MKRQVTVVLLVAFLFLLSIKAHSADDGKDTGIVSMVHVGVPVSDLTKALHFYVDQLGFSEAFRLNKADGTPMLVYLKVKNSDTFVELFPGAKAPSTPAQPMVYHMGFMVDDLQATLHALKDKGYPLPDDAFDKASKIAGDGTNYYFVSDPDGNHIELSQLRPDSFQVKAAPGLLKRTGGSGSAGGTPIDTSVTAKSDSPLVPFKSGQLRILLQGNTAQLSSARLGTLDMAPGQTLGPETHTPKKSSSRYSPKEMVRSILMAKPSSFIPAVFYMRSRIIPRQSPTTAKFRLAITGLLL